MRYEEARGKVKNGDIIAVSGTGFFSWLIRTWTRSTYSHVGVAYWINDRLLIYEAMERHGVRIVPLSNRAPFYWIPVPWEWSEACEDLVWETQGLAGYDRRSILRRIIGMELREDERWYCSELARHAVNIMGAELPQPSGRDPQALVATAMMAGAGPLHLINGDDE